MFYIVSLIVTPAAQRQLLTNLYQEVDLRHIVFLRMYLLFAPVFTKLGSLLHHL
jgi:hypothetical protein